MLEARDVPAASVALTAFHDADGDGGWDAGEAGVGGASMGYYDATLIMQNLTTGAGGTATAAVTAASTYMYGASAPAGWTLPGGGTMVSGMFNVPDGSTHTITLGLVPAGGGMPGGGGSNSPPVASPDSYAVHARPAGVPAGPQHHITGNVLSNDTDANADPLTAAVQTNPAHGTLTFNADGSFDYLPAAGYVGADSFTYTASDGTAASSPATVTLNVTNTTPVANGNTYTTAEDTPLVVPATGLLGNDTDADGDPLAVAGVTMGPMYGALAVAADGSFVYTPSAGYSGGDSFMYQATDGLTTSGMAYVSLAVAPVNRPPVSANDGYTVNEGATLTAWWPGVLGNDGDPDGDMLAAGLVVGPAHGTLSLNGDGSFSYTPAAGYDGPDGFTYAASDGYLTGNTAAVSITVLNVNHAPVAADDAATVHAHPVGFVGPLPSAAGNVLGNDTDPDDDDLTASLMMSPANGVVTLNEDGTFDYVPDAGYVGADSFSYTVSDGALSDYGTVSIQMTNAAPTAAGDAAAAHARPAGAEPDWFHYAVGNVLGNDADADGDALKAALVSGPSHGTLALLADGDFEYLPNAGYVGSDSFTYTASDGLVSTASATVSLSATNAAPVAAGDAYGVHKDTPLTVEAPGVLGNDSDADADEITAVVVTPPAHGELALGSDGSFTYTPDEDYVGSDAFAYKATDGLADSAAATVSLTVHETNSPPVSADDAYETMTDTPIRWDDTNVLANDTDADGDPLTAAVVTEPAHGELTFFGDGTFVYTPDDGFEGADSFTYKANDGRADGNTATVSIAVVHANVAPVVTVPEPTFIDPGQTVTFGTVTAADADAGGAVVRADLSAWTGTLTLSDTAGLTFTAGDGTADEAMSFTGTLAAINASLAGLLFDPDAPAATQTGFTLYVDDLGNTGAGGPKVGYDSARVVVGGPFAAGDAYTTRHDRELEIPALEGVLANDDVEPDSDFAPAVEDGPGHGTLSLSADGSFTYEPAAGFVGEDGFTYVLTDGETESDPVEVTITVTNAEPTAAGAEHAIHANTTLGGEDATVGGLGDDDEDEVTVSVVAGPQHAETFTLNSDGTFTYTPLNGYVGNDEFRVKPWDGIAYGDETTVTIHVTNAAPVVSDEAYTLIVPTDTQAAGNVLANDTDADNDELTAELVETEEEVPGTLTFNSDGSFTFTPVSTFRGEWSFDYVVSDGIEEVTGTATITVVENGKLNDDYYVADMTEELEVSDPDDGVLVNDDLPAGENALPQLVEDVPSSEGMLVLGNAQTNAAGDVTFDGTFRFVPAATFSGATSFKYTLVSAAAGSVGATVYLKSLLDGVALKSVKFHSHYASDNLVPIREDIAQKLYTTDDGNNSNPQYVAKPTLPGGQPPAGKRDAATTNPVAYFGDGGVYEGGVFYADPSRIQTTVAMRLQPTYYDWLKRAIASKAKTVGEAEFLKKTFGLTGDVSARRLAIKHIDMSANTTITLGSGEGIGQNQVGALVFTHLYSTAHANDNSYEGLGRTINYEDPLAIDWKMYSPDLPANKLSRGVSENTFYVVSVYGRSLPSITGQKYTTRWWT